LEGKNPALHTHLFLSGLYLSLEYQIIYSQIHIHNPHTHAVTCFMLIFCWEVEGWLRLEDGPFPFESPNPKSQFEEAGPKPKEEGYYYFVFLSLECE
jgi:hypothetical protein